MTQSKVEKFIQEANIAAGNGDWQSAIDHLSQAEEIAPQDAGVLSGLGVCLLQAGRPDDAISYFTRVTVIETKTADVFCNLGMAYTATKEFDKAEVALLKALEIDLGHILTRKNLAVLYVKQEERLGEGLQLLVNLMKENPNDLESVLMLASFYLLGGQLESAAKLCDYALATEPENNMALEIKKRITEINLAKEPEQVPAKLSDETASIARPEHAQKLSGLKNLRRENDSGMQATSIAAKGHMNDRGFPKTPESLFFCGGQELSVGLRFFTPAKTLERKGIKVKLSIGVEAADLTDYSTFVFSRPHLEQKWVDGFQAAAKAGKRLVIDIDEDFHNLPPEHPGYNLLGNGNPQALEIFERMLQRADLVTASSPYLVERYRSLSRQIKYLPTTWDHTMDVWNKAAPNHHTFNVGWCDYASEVPNLAVAKNEIARFIKETPDALLVIGGDLRGVEYFNGLLPEDKIFFIPFVGIDEYPFLLSHFNVILSPDRKLAYNQAKPDTRLMEAGARRIPWIASRIPSYEEWGDGGIFADKGEDWYSALEKLYNDPSLYHNLAEAGRKKAEERTTIALSNLPFIE